MKTVTIKKRPAWQNPFTKGMVPRHAFEGVCIFVNGVNVLGGNDDDDDNSFYNSDYESTDGYAAVKLLAALERMGILSLEYDSEIAEAYPNSLKP